MARAIGMAPSELGEPLRHEAKLAELVVHWSSSDTVEVCWLVGGRGEREECSVLLEAADRGRPASPTAATERHIGAAQPGAQPTWDLSSVTMDQRMADLVRV